MLKGWGPQMIINFRTIGFVCAAALMPQAAAASSTGTTMPVTAITISACAVSATPLVFGTLNQIGGTANDGQSTVVVTCTPGTAYEVGMDNGAHAVGGVRQMAPTLGTARVPYVLYSNAARSTVWGNTTGTNTVGGTAGVLPTTLNVYGRVPAGTMPVAVDVYTDAVTVTVTF